METIGLDQTQKEMLEDIREKVNKELGDYLALKIEEFDHIHPMARNLANRLSQYVLRGGKRIRPTLVVLGHIASGGELGREILRASLSMELMQGFLLIEDDVMDQASLRRGGPTIHKTFTDDHNKANLKGPSARFGENVAITGGLIVGYWGVECLTSAGFPPNPTLEAVMLYSETVEATGIGQLFDLTFGVSHTSSVEDVLLIQEYKTSLYTIANPLRMGAMLGEAPGELLEGFRNFGVNIGIAFQLHDDYLGLFGNEKILGKSVLSDLAEGKQTVPIVKALELARPGDREFIIEILGNPQLTMADLSRVRDIVESTGALAYSMEMEMKYLHNGLSVLEELSIPRKIKKVLTSLANYIVSRHM
ncbi:MAG: polyprenyl synthetase family protein [Methanomassiliicoccales archaeon]|nr:MAG: polyprenyl synthetase family protein [Methanomassiliicoccales archaeon]